MSTLTTLLLITCVVLALTVGDPETNGPTGVQTFKGQKQAKTMVFTNKITKGKKPGSQSGNAAVSTGRGANLNVANEKLLTSKSGKTASATRNGQAATAKDTTGKKNYAADAKGKKTKADVSGHKVTKAEAGNKKISAEYVKSAKTAKAANLNGKESWSSNLRGKKGTAVENNSRKKATLNGIKKGQRKVYGKANGKSIIAGKKKRKKSNNSYAVVPKKRRGRVQYVSQQKSRRTSTQTRVLKGKKNPIYHNSANKKNEVALHDAKSKKKLAAIKAKRYKPVPCKKLKNNMWKENSKDFEFYDETMKIDYPEKNGGYVFPSCMDISVDIKLPPGTRVKDLVASVTVVMPNCGELSCGKEKKCLGHNCFYDSLCHDKNVKPSKEHKDPANYLLSQTDNNACGDNFKGGRVPLVFNYCPDVNSELNQKNTCEKGFLKTFSVASLEVQIDVWTVKKRPVGCNENSSADRKNVRKLGCKRVLCDYQMKWFGSPDLGSLKNAVGKGAQDLNCFQGKRPCLGHDKPGGFFGFGGK